MGHLRNWRMRVEEWSKPMRPQTFGQRLAYLQNRQYMILVLASEKNQQYRPPKHTVNPTQNSLSEPNQYKHVEKAEASYNQNYN